MPKPLEAPPGTSSRCSFENQASGFRAQLVTRGDRLSARAQGLLRRRTAFNHPSLSQYLQQGSFFGISRLETCCAEASPHMRSLQWYLDGWGTGMIQNEMQLLLSNADCSKCRRYPTVERTTRHAAAHMKLGSSPSTDKL